ncbi:PQQ-binding-like beta-propeller repeat protein [Fimbriimonas ginsengisoli]|uniref:Uncharacterized protein n=1 Tax=Fimbriimonas ginsengisoli Gsoil 348 TaxID=661478 RepID=A0A068NVY6_FIMGI|nr:PQQ-binding-like beta-propeller repeat protein [Fimbriimonas ginsengisoli]AIE85774.1 hypothetical protein OP10G_2406 [Fimbriimonas ginsengisoli Gsoil 348]
MGFRKSIWLGVAMMATTLAGAQAVYDFSTLGGQNARSGRNGDPHGTSPGRTPGPRWSKPDGLNLKTFKVVIDQSDTQTAQTPAPVDGGDGFPWDLNPYGYVTSTQQATDPWSSPANANAWASPVYDKYIRSQANAGTGAPVNHNYRTPPYLFAKCTPSRADSDYISSTGNLSTFTWRFTGTGNTPKNYAIRVQIPVGPTIVGGIRTLPQRYYAYEVHYGVAGQGVFRDIVDTYTKDSGGWVRLGAGGAPTDMVIPFDGVNPITVTLYNTVPRNPLTGNFTMPTSSNTGELGLDKYVVYADAVRFDENPGYYDASPVAQRLVDADPLSTTVTAALNSLSVGKIGGLATTLVKGEVTNYNYASGAQRWRWSALEEGDFSKIIDNETNMSGFVDDSTARAIDGQAGTAPVSTTDANNDGTTEPTAFVTYDSGKNGGAILPDDLYDIYVYLPGDDATHQYGRSIRYDIVSYSGTFSYRLDQSLARGWVKLGDRRFENINDVANGGVQLKVTVTNQSNLAADQTRIVYADAIRFVGQANYAIRSTPIHATALIRDNDALGTLVSRKVVVVADENGVLHCLDATGNPDNTTTEYWRYPSTRDSNGLDPNLGAPGAPGPDYNGPDSTPAAERFATIAPMNGFNLSSGLVQRIGGQDYLFIANQNGRVYKIDMAGRGDFNKGGRTIGTTFRVWTFPATYPSAIQFPTGFRSIEGSVAYGEPNNVPTIYVPTMEGRLYALAAIGNAADKSTTVSWTFPALNAPTTGAMATTPAVRFGKVYVGTLRKSTTTGDLPGRYYALDWVNGTQQWVFPNDVAGTQGNTTRRTDDFLASPALADGTELDPAAPVGTPGSLFTINQNRIVYSLNAETGAINWQTDELLSGGEAPLTFTWKSVLDSTGVFQAVPVVLVPTQSGLFAALFARAADLEVDGTRTAWGRLTQGDYSRTQMAVEGLAQTDPATNPAAWMYGADTGGFLYAWNDAAGYTGTGDAPGADYIVANDPRGAVYRKTKVKLITRSTYQALRLPTGGAGHYNYPTAIGKPGPGTSPSGNFVFEWGQTAYFLVYDFPFITKDTNGDDIDPPVVNISFSTDGKTLRGVAIQSRQFSNPATAPTFNQAAPTSVTLPAPDGDLPMDGYAILAFPLQSSGANSLPPGDGDVSVSISTAALNTNNIQQTIGLDPKSSRKTFQIANPLAIFVGPATVNGSSLTATNPSVPTGANPYGIGLKTDPWNVENLGNGSFDAGGGHQSQLTSSAPLSNHGGTTKSVVYLVDRSMMSLLRADGLTQGLDGVRVYRRDLAWQGSSQAVIKPFSNLYPNFEDLPVNFPNNSLDYPDIRRENISFVKDPNGSAENPLYQSGVTLLPPLDKTTLNQASKGAMDEDTLPQNRIFRAVPLEITVDVPRYQPPNNYFSLSSLNPAALQSNSLGNTAAGKAFQQGYIGRFDVFVDSNGNGRVDTTTREAYRSFNFATGIDMDERLSVTTPTVDLGDLAASTGYEPNIRPGVGFTGTNTPLNIFQPWFGKYTPIFKPFGVANEGNVNLLDVRLAKVASQNGSPVQTLGIYSTENDYRGYLDAAFDVWSDVDPAFGVGPDAQHRVILQKPRVQDRVPTRLQSNPVRRENPNLGVTGLVKVAGEPNPFEDVLNPTLVGTVGNRSLAFQHAQNKAKAGIFAPVVGASVPIGFPVGKYAERIRVFENSNHNFGFGSPLWDTATDAAGRGTEPYTDQGFLLSFNVTETRLTNGPTTPTTPTMLDDSIAGGSAGQFRNANIQPAGARDVYGSLLMAFASNRPSWDATVANVDNGAYKLFFATLDNRGNFTGSGFTAPPAISPLRDLNAWQGSTSSQWFRQAVQGYPSTSVATLFGFPAASLLPGTLKYGNPAFPALGAQDPYSLGNNFTGLYMAFTGQAQHTNPDGSVQNDSRLFMSVVTPGSAGTITVTPTPAVLADDPQSVKGRPTLVQSGGSGSSTAMVFYPVTSAGQSSILYTRFNGSTFSAPSALPFGSGFSAVSAPSAVGRLYASGRTDQAPVVELTFQGKLRGRPYPEIFLARLRTSGPNGVPSANPDRILEDMTGAVDQANVFMPQAEIGNELLTKEGEAGLYRSRGVQWQPGSPIQLTQILAGTATELLLTNTAVYDQRTGIVSFDTRLGGKVFMDPAVGTVRFSSSVPSRNAQMFLTYTPRFLRISEGGAAGYNDPTGLFDGRLITDPTFWRTASNAQADFSTTGVDGRQLSNDRMIFTYNRATVGTGQAARPFIQTMRFGVNLPYRIPTLDNGTAGLVIGNSTVNPIVSITWTDGGASDAFQLDPVRASATGNFTSSGNGQTFNQASPGQGAIYFPSTDEGRSVTIKHYGMDEAGRIVRDAGNAPVVFTTIAKVALIPERTEAPLPIQTAVNESNLLSFLDPFTYAAERRPPMVWLLWTSTRNGSPDLYFETISPRWSSIPIGR